MSGQVITAKEAHKRAIQSMKDHEREWEEYAIEEARHNKILCDRCEEEEQTFNKNCVCGAPTKIITIKEEVNYIKQIIVCARTGRAENDCTAKSST